MKYTYENVNMLGDLILIEPAQELNTLIQKIAIPDDSKNVGKKSKVNAIKETKEVEEPYNTIYQVGTVLSVGLGVPGNNIKVGERIIYNIQGTKVLDLLAKEHNDKTCPHMIKSWDVIGKIREVEQENTNKTNE